MPSGVHRYKTHTIPTVGIIGGAIGAGLAAPGALATGNLGGLVSGAKAGWDVGHDWDSRGREGKVKYPKNYLPIKENKGMTGKRARPNYESGMQKKLRNITKIARNKPRVTTARAKRKWARRRRRGTVKFGRKFRKQIKSVVKRELACGENQGVYEKLWTGDLGVGALDCMWFYSHLQANANAATVTTTEAMRFIPITYKKILDAASVLFNAKTADLAYELDAGGKNLDRKKTVVEIMYAAASWEIKNGTQLTYDVEEYVITNKSSSDQDFLTTWKSVSDQDSWGTAPTLTDKKDVYVEANFSTTTQNYFYINNFYLHKPGMQEAMKTFYKIKCNKIKLTPGSSIKRYFKYHHKCVDFTRGMDNVGALATFVKGDQQVVYRIVPELHMGYVPGSANAGDFRGAYTASTFGLGLTIKRKEVYHMSPPENATVLDEKRILYEKYSSLTASTKLMGAAWNHCVQETHPIYS